jgi:hypothetical protein
MSIIYSEKTFENNVPVAKIHVKPNLVSFPGHGSQTGGNYPWIPKKSQFRKMEEQTRAIRIIWSTSPCRMHLSAFHLNVRTYVYQWEMLSYQW